MLKAVDGTRIVGAVRVREDGPVLRVGRLSVAPDQQGRGVGTALLAAAEALAGPGAHTVSLFTGEASVENVRLYERCGYAVVRHEALPPGPGILHLDKALARPVSG